MVMTGLDGLAVHDHTLEAEAFGAITQEEVLFFLKLFFYFS